MPVQRSHHLPNWLLTPRLKSIKKKTKAKKGAPDMLDTASVIATNVSPVPADTSSILTPVTWDRNPRIEYTQIPARIYRRGGLLSEER